jgi:hypothetical protein
VEAKKRLVYRSRSVNNRGKLKTRQRRSRGKAAIFGPTASAGRLHCGIGKRAKRPNSFKTILPGATHRVYLLMDLLSRPEAPASRSRWQRFVAGGGVIELPTTGAGYKGWQASAHPDHDVLFGAPRGVAVEPGGAGASKTAGSGVVDVVKTLEFVCADMWKPYLGDAKRARLARARSLHIAMHLNKPLDQLCHIPNLCTLASHTTGSPSVTTSPNLVGSSSTALSQLDATAAARLGSAGADGFVPRREL